MYFPICRMNNMFGFSSSAKNVSALDVEEESQLDEKMESHHLIFLAIVLEIALSSSGSLHLL